MRIDIVADIETLGNKVDSTIIQIAAVSFDIKTGNIFNKFNEIANIELCDDLKVTGSTLKWWLNTNKELFAKLINGGKLSPKQIIKSFYTWLTYIQHGNDVYLWGNGILFDNKILQHQMQNNGLEYPIFYRNDRDMRTLVELASYKIGMQSEKEFRNEYKNPDLVEHDAFDDAMQQVEIIVKAHNILME